MRYDWKRNKTDRLLTSFLGFIFLLQILMLPLSYSDERTVVSHNFYVSFISYEEAFIVNKLTGNELLNYIGVHHYFERNIRDVQRIFFRNMEAILFPVVILGIIFSLALTFLKRVRQRISILSISLGGHAPPVRIVH